MITDPLLDMANSRVKAGSKPPTKEQTVDKMKEIIGNIEKKLKGMMIGFLPATNQSGSSGEKEAVRLLRKKGERDFDHNKGISLSVAGQVDELIRAAMDHRNLSRMYVGWMPWL